MFVYFVVVTICACIRWVYDDYNYVKYFVHNEDAKFYSRNLFNAWDWSVNSEGDMKVQRGVSTSTIMFEMHREKMMEDIKNRKRSEQIRLNIRKAFSFTVNILLIFLGIYLILLARDKQFFIEQEL